VFFGVAAMLLAQTGNGIVGLCRVPSFAGPAERSRWRLSTSPVAARHRRAVPTEGARCS
jgi:hypothetical protein